MKPWQNILFGTFLGLAASAVLYLVVIPPKGEPISLPPTPTAARIMVYITGAVNSPGVFSLPRDSRIVNVVEAAGGFTDLAEQEAVNLAAKLNDGDRIHIPALGEQINPEAASPTQTIGSKSLAITPLPSLPININKATVEELDKLPNIGATKAAAIIEYRTQHGPFTKLEDIQNVPGIGPSTFEKIKPMITIEK